jgi:hypothetical protein
VRIGVTSPLTTKK